MGCASDLRTDRDVLSSLSKQGRAPVSTDQALTFCQRMEGTTYVETSAKISSRAAISAFEVAALASMGKIPPPTKNSGNSFLLSAQCSPLEIPKNNQQETKFANFNRSRYVHSRVPSSPQNSLERKDNLELRDTEPDLYGIEPAEQFWEQFNSSLIHSPKISRSISAPRTPSLGSAR